MRRSILPLAGCLLALTSITTGRVVAQQKPAESKPAAEAKAEASKPEAEKAEAAEAKPKPPAAKPKQPVAKPEQPAKPEKPAVEKPATHTVKPELFKIEVSLKGNFEAQSMTEIKLRPEAWASLKVAKAVDHGATVDRGDVLVEFELEDIDKAIDDHRRKVELAELGIKLAEENLKALEATTPMDLESAERSKRYADEDLARFLKIDRAMIEKYANFDVESSQNYLDYAKEELRQLEKMYKADDLTEETEEIILKRQRDMVKRYEFYLEQSKYYRDQDLEVRLPRLEGSMKRLTQRESLDLNKVKATLPIALNQTRLELESLKVQLSKDQERLEDLTADREAMTVKAPGAGVVYYGRFDRGKWGGATSIAAKLREGGSVAANEVFITIVKTRPMLIHTELPEKHLHQIRPGLRGKVQPTALPDLRLDATVASVSPLPISAGNLEATLRVNLPGEAEALVPGMSCSVKFIPYLNRRALTVPASAVSTDELDDQKHHVCLVTDDGEQKKRQVTVGKKTEDRVEILVGLEEGDEVVKEFPKDKK